MANIYQSLILKLNRKQPLTDRDFLELLTELYSASVTDTINTAAIATLQTTIADHETRIDDLETP